MGSRALVAWLFGERYGLRTAWGVTRRCLPGGISRRGDRSPEGATAPVASRPRRCSPSSVWTGPPSASAPGLACSGWRRGI